MCVIDAACLADSPYIFTAKRSEWMRRAPRNKSRPPHNDLTGSVILMRRTRRRKRGRFRGASTTAKVQFCEGCDFRKTSKQMKTEYGREEYGFYVAFHVEKHGSLANQIDNWRRDFVALRGREPCHEDVPEVIHNLKKTYLSLSFK